MDSTIQVDSLQEEIISKSIFSGHNLLNPETSKMLKEMGITSLIMNSGELVDTSGYPIKSEPQKPKRHKNQLGYIDPTVAGIDIGDKLIHVSIPDCNGGNYVKEYGTTTPELKVIIQDLKNAKVETGVMEATGVYWIPLYEMMEQEDLKPVLVDAKKCKNVPGRKTDCVDCQWIQVLYSSGLLTAAFRPSKNRIKLRSYVRQRLNIIKTRQFSLEHMEKALQLMNIKLSTAVSDIAGISGMAIIRAIVEGKRDPVELAKLRSVKCKKTDQVFVAALTGSYQEEHCFALNQALALYDFGEKQLIECDQKIKNELESYPTVTNAPLPKRDKDKKANGKYAEARKTKKNDVTFDVRTLLWQKSGIDTTALPGVQASTALSVYAEMGGTDVRPWRNEKAFTSWMKLCPGNNISGGKRKKSPRVPCANYVAQALRMSALAAKRTNSALGAQIRRISGRTDKSKGIKAGAHKLAILLYYMCKEGWAYHEKGAESYEKAHAERHKKNLEKQAKIIGFKLTPNTEEV